MNRTLPTPWKPTKAQLLAAHNKLVPDLAAKNLIVLFAGINPGLYTAAIGRHFGRPGNRFWPALHRSGFTPRQLAPWEEDELLGLGLGITNLVARTTAVAAELSAAELREGGTLLVARLEEYRPTWLAMLGMGSYRAAFGLPAAAMGPQPESLGPSRVWLLPNPSGLNAHYQLDALAAEFGRLREAI